MIPLIVCVKCGRLMTCQKTGMDVRVDEHYSYRGDRFECKHCKTEIAVANPTGIYSPNVIEPNQWTVDLKD